MALTGSVMEHVEAPARDVFALVTDIDRLPEWNRVIRRVVDRPTVLEREAEWIVELHAMGTTWQSRARVLEHDHGAMRFVYRSMTDDGNPSYADWRWEIDDEQAGTRVTVSWELSPRTFWRQTLLAPVRNRQLRREVRDSVRALAGVLTS